MTQVMSTIGSGRFGLPPATTMLRSMAIDYLDGKSIAGSMRPPIFTPLSVFEPSWKNQTRCDKSSRREASLVPSAWLVFHLMAASKHLCDRSLCNLVLKFCLPDRWIEWIAMSFQSKPESRYRWDRRSRNREPTPMGSRHRTRVCSVAG